MGFARRFSSRRRPSHGIDLTADADGLMRLRRCEELGDPVRQMSSADDFQDMEPAFAKSLKDIVLAAETLTFDRLMRVEGAGFQR